MSDETLEVIAQVPNVCKHIHLPVQSGHTVQIPFSGIFAVHQFQDTGAAALEMCIRDRTYTERLCAVSTKNTTSPNSNNTSVVPVSYTHLPQELLSNM